MKLSADELRGLLDQLAITEEVELDCEGCLARVSRFAEHRLSGKTPDEALRQVRQHLAICADCREEYEGLLAALGTLAE